MQATHLTLPSPAPRAQNALRASIRLVQGIRYVRHAHQTATTAEVQVLASAAWGTVRLMVASVAQLVFRARIRLRQVTHNVVFVLHTALRAAVRALASAILVTHPTLPSPASRAYLVLMASIRLKLAIRHAIIAKLTETPVPPSQAVVGHRRVTANQATALMTME